MRIDVFTGGIKNQGLSYLYLTDEEISQYGLEPTNFEGKKYDWITLPERDALAEPGERLVAAYGGNLSEICCSQPEMNIYNAANVCFYTLPGWDEGGPEEELDYLPNDLREKLCSAIKEHCGTFNRDDFKKPFFNGSHWVERDETREQSFMPLSDIHKIIDQEEEGVWYKNDDKQSSLEPDETLRHTFGDTTAEFGIRYPLNKENPVNILTLSDSDPNGTRTQLYVKGNIETAKILVDNTIKHFDKEQKSIKNVFNNPNSLTMTRVVKIDDIKSYLASQILEPRQEAEFKSPQDFMDTVQLAKKAGYVQGVCECVAVIDSYDRNTAKRYREIGLHSEGLSKKLLSEMNVTKDMAQKYASPETYKALEQGIFAPQQKQTQTRGIKR